MRILWKQQQPIPAIVIFLAGSLFGIFVGTVTFISPQKTDVGRSIRQGTQHLTNPLLACNAESSESPRFAKLKADLANTIAVAHKEGKVSKASVYIHDLNSGEWTGVNTDATYDPASLLKVGLMMVYFRVADVDPTLLTRTIDDDLAEDANAVEDIKPAQPIEPGKKYSVDALLNAMIVESDNNAMTLLMQHLDDRVLRNTFADLQQKLPEANETRSFMTAPSYALLFRILYNASYLSRVSSEKALDILSKVKFNEGISAVIPKEISVMHKFGERTQMEQGIVVNRELHDCGIVYYPNHPYVLCVMTSGNEQSVLKLVLQEISSQAFDFMKNEYPRSEITARN